MSVIRRGGSGRWAAAAVALAVWYGTISGCGPEGVGTITIPKEAGGKGFSPSAPEEIPRTKSSAGKKTADESALPGQDALPKAARRKG